MTAAKYVAIDIGAESGRAMLASFDGARLALDPVLRFPNVPVKVGETLRWDVNRLFDDIQRGVGMAVAQHGNEIVGMGLDTWGVDFALLDANDEMLGLPFHYRDVRNAGMIEKVFERVPRAKVFAQTGIQFMEINSLYQLYAMRLQNAPELDAAATFLMIPDLFHFWLTGIKGCEFTDATTTQCFDPRKLKWALPLLQDLGIPTAMFPEIIEPGTVLGPLKRELAEATHFNGKLVVPACHDTGSAVVAVPSEGENAAWISSGTWSILGAEVPQPVVNETSLLYNFTNEGGVNQTFRLCKNVAGLWLVQECRRTWQQQGTEYSYAQLMELAEREPAFASLIDPDDVVFLRPGDMPARIAEYCKQHGQPVPSSVGATMRCVLESLGLKYRFQLERLETLLGKTLDTVHIVGGGTNNTLLCQFTANATGKRVIAGPVEATTLGNVLMQMLALGQIGSLAEGRQVVRASFENATYEPKESGAWDEAYRRFGALVASR